MADPGDLGHPLSDEEWVAVEDFLDAPGGPNIHTCVGFLTAIASGPTHIHPGEWLPLVFGTRPVESPNERVVGLVLRMFNAIVAGLGEECVFYPDAGDVEEVGRWCAGYMMGVDLDDAWLEHDDVISAIFPIAVLGGHTALDEGDEDPIDDEDGWRLAAGGGIGDIALEAFELLAQARNQLAAAAAGVAQAPRTGRNDPCPCGSGKKHKKCCLGK